MRKEYISIIVPAYNEELRVPASIEKISAYLEGRFEQYEIIVINDGSTDGTAERVRELSARLGNIRLIENESNRGKGLSVRRGVMASSGELVLVTDADLSTPIEELGKLLERIDQGADIAAGSRWMKDSDVPVRQPWYRLFISRVFNLIVRALAIGSIRDTQCGFKLYRGGVARELFNKSRFASYSFDPEVLFLADRTGRSIAEVPVRWLNSPDSKVRIVRDSTRMFLDLIKMRFFWITGKYK